MGARVYIPSIGRFLSVDPTPGTLPNLYTYPLDPINSSDLSGKTALSTLLAEANMLAPLTRLPFIGGLFIATYTVITEEIKELEEASRAAAQKNTVTGSGSNSRTNNPAINQVAAASGGGDPSLIESKSSILQAGPTRGGTISLLSSSNIIAALVGCGQGMAQAMVVGEVLTVNLGPEAGGADMGMGCFTGAATALANRYSTAGGLAISGLDSANTAYDVYNKVVAVPPPEL